MNTTRIADLRQEVGWTQERLATESGVGLRTIQRLEAGSEASLETLSLVADALRVSVRDLFTAIDDTDFANRVQALESRVVDQQAARDGVTAAWRWLYVGIGVVLSLFSFTMGQYGLCRVPRLLDGGTYDPSGASEDCPRTATRSSIPVVSEQAATPRAAPFRAALRAHGSRGTVNSIDQFKLAELSIEVFGSPETFAAIYDDVVQLLETKYEQTTWEIASEEDVTDNVQHRDVLHRLRLEAERDALHRVRLDEESASGSS